MADKVKRPIEQVLAHKADRALTSEYYITDHALWRWAERNLGFWSAKAVRKELKKRLTKMDREGLEELGFKIRGKAIVTYIPPSRGSR